MAITTIATRTRIKAYSTNPCPSSRGINNISFTPFPLRFLPRYNIGYIITIARLAVFDNSPLVLLLRGRDLDPHSGAAAYAAVYLHLAAEHLGSFL